MMLQILLLIYYDSTGISQGRVEKTEESWFLIDESDSSDKKKYPVRVSCCLTKNENRRI